MHIRDKDLNSFYIAAIIGTILAIACGLSFGQPAPEAVLDMGENIGLDTSNFGNNLSPTEDDVQKAMDKIDDISVSGLADPMTTRGDVIIRDATNTTNRLGIGANGEALLSDGTDISWGAVGVGSLSLTGLTDVNSATATDGRILIGTGSKFDSVILSGDATITRTGNVQLTNNSVGSPEIAANAVTTSELVDIGTATDGDGRLWINDNTDFKSVIMSGDTTINKDGVTAIQSGAIGLTDLSDVNSATVTAGRLLIADGSDFHSVDMGGDATITKTGAVSLATDSVGTNELIDIATITATDSYMFVADGTDFQSVPMSGDTTINNTGAVKIGVDKVGTAELADINSATATNGRIFVANGTDFHSVIMSGGATILRTGHVNITTDSFHNGTFRESFDALVTSDGATITLTVTNSSGGNLTTQFSSGNSTFTGGSTIELTAGAGDDIPQTNYIYILESAPTVLVKSTTEFPTAAEHIRVGFFFVPTEAYVAADGAYINQNWNDHLANGDNQGHLAHLGEWVRLGGAHGYSSGLGGAGDAGTYVTRTDASPDTVYVETSPGVLYQFHRQDVGAKDSSPGNDDFHVVNQNGDAYADGHDLYDFLDDADGDPMNVIPARYYNLVLWIVGNKTGEYSPLMINLPTCSYSTEGGAELDSLGCDVYSLPRQFVLDSNTGHLIARLTMKWTNSGSDLELISTVDLRGTEPTVVTGGGGSGHDPVSLAGQDYLSIAGQIITANEIEPDDLAGSNFGDFTCDGDVCALNTDSVGVNELADINSATATAGRIFVADGSDFQSVDMTGDVDITKAGVTSLATDSVGTNELADINSATATAGRIFVANDTDFDSVAMGGDTTIDKAGIVYLENLPRCVFVEDLVAADDGKSMGSFGKTVVIGNVWCQYKGTGDTIATITLEDGSGNAMTITDTNPTCTAEGTPPDKKTVTANNALTATELLRFNVTNTPDPETDDYTICVDWK